MRTHLEASGLSAANVRTTFNAVLSLASGRGIQHPRGAKPPFCGGVLVDIGDDLDALKRAAAEWLPPAEDTSKGCKVRHPLSKLQAFKAVWAGGEDVPLAAAAPGARPPGLGGGGGGGGASGRSRGGGEDDDDFDDFDDNLSLAARRPKAPRAAAPVRPTRRDEAADSALQESDDDDLPLASRPRPTKAAGEAPLVRKPAKARENASPQQPPQQAAAHAPAASSCASGAPAPGHAPGAGRPACAQGSRQGQGGGWDLFARFAYTG